MFEKRLLAFVGATTKPVVLVSFIQWLGLLAGVVVTFAMTRLVEDSMVGRADLQALVTILVLVISCAALRLLLTSYASKKSFNQAREVKKRLRVALFEKLTLLGPGYSATATTAEVTQTASEGIDQLEAYFAKYLPQFAFSVLASGTLALVLAPLYLPVALVLLICTPLIPLLLFVQSKMAMRVMRRQWNAYTSLGDRFLENLQAMTSLKVYGADAIKQDEMAAESESFRQSTMRLLRMQLASILCMDIIAFGGAAAGVILALQAFAHGSVGIGGTLAIILLSAEFFIPLRQLGSLFHVAMNGAAASRKVFALLDMPVPARGTRILPAGEMCAEVSHLDFSYIEDRKALRDITCCLAPGNLISFVGASGSGKSTMAALLAGRFADYVGSIRLAGIELGELAHESIQERVVLIGHDAYIFAGTIEDNLRLAKPDACLSELQAVLEAVCLSGEVALDSCVKERGSNLSGGQRQRLGIARALLSDRDFYIFDEAASNIDGESERVIMELIHQLAQTKTVLLISHRLANVVLSSCIYLFDGGRIIEAGTHAELLGRGGDYCRLWMKQSELEDYSACFVKGDQQCA